MAVDHRLIEDYIPIEAISEEARREKSIRKGHISTLHLWWARRPLVAARAAVYSTLTPAPVDKQSAAHAADFVTELCKYPGSPGVVTEAQRHILQAHAERLTGERQVAGQPPEQARVTVEDIEAGRAPRPRVLDMFAGGGAIPLEALRLGCEAYAVDLNPVAHLIELCTLVYPQQFGAPDPCAKGSSKDGTWAGLAAEGEHWSQWVLERAQAELGDLYPPIPNPRAKPRDDSQPSQLAMDLAISESHASYHSRTGMLTPVAYLWTRTVRCKNPACGATVPLARQTWLAQKEGRFVALRPDTETNRDKEGEEKRVRYNVVEATSSAGLGFDPGAGSQGGHVGCPFCSTVVDIGYIRAEGIAHRIGIQPMAVLCLERGKQGKAYLAADQVPSSSWPHETAIWTRIDVLSSRTTPNDAQPLTAPMEGIEANPRSMDVQNYGFLKWADLFTPRQLLSLLTITQIIRDCYSQLLSIGYTPTHAKVVTTYLGIIQSRLTDFCNALCTVATAGGRGIRQVFSRQALPMVWDFAEANPLNSTIASWSSMSNAVTQVLRRMSLPNNLAVVQRGSATATGFVDDKFDAVITDPPYYDNVSYSNLSDFFYVWLARSIGYLYPEHFSTPLTPKKREAIAAPYRHNGGREEAKRFYEGMMSRAFAEANRVLKPGAPMVVVYAHKTTLGWATLVDALRDSGFTVTEAWPLDTEQSHRSRAMETASLASSIFLVARRREGNSTGSYERDVRTDLQAIVRERLDRLWAQGITGADLVIACVGAGLRAFTKYARVEYANGQPVPADSFLAEVEGAVLEALLEKLFGVSQVGMSSVDGPTRFYVLWRYAYRSAAIDAGEAIIFAYPQHVELDGPRSVSAGHNPLVEKLKGTYRLRDFIERGEDEDLGIAPHGGPEQASLIDVLHRLLWLVENRPLMIQSYLDQAQPDIERLRIVAQTLAGQTLAGNGSGGGKSLIAARGAEASALRKLTTNWRTLIEAHRGPLA